MASRPRVLIVDDDAAIRALVTAILSRAGYAVDTARDGCEAIEMIAAADYDGVILDVMMPRLDGFGVIEALQQIDQELLGRTLVLTASHLERLQELPVFGVMSKPFGIDELIEQTRACVACQSEPRLSILPETAPATSSAHAPGCPEALVELSPSTTDH